jgi:hypothetical protein
MMDVAQLKTQASRCRRLAQTFANQTTAEMLNRMAAEFDRVAHQSGTESTSLRVVPNRSGR